MSRLRVPTNRLALGMFVAELDKPWTDTPFLLQGFRLAGRDDLALMRLHCEWVVVDRDRSLEEAHGTIDLHGLPVDDPGERLDRMLQAQDAASTGDPASASSNRPSSNRPSPYPPAPSPPSTDVSLESTRADPAIATTVRAPRRWSLGRLLRRLLAWLRLRGAEGLADGRIFPARAAADGIAGGAGTTADSLLPPGHAAHVYPPPVDVTAELPRARTTMATSEVVITRLLADVRADRPPDIAGLGPVAEGVVQSMMANPDAMMWVMRLREDDARTYHHGIKVALYLVALGRHLGFPPQSLQDLFQMGVLADLGKTRLPRSILDKPGNLSADEFDAVKRHVDIAIDVLTGAESLAPEVLAGIAQHHERVDGTGYPRGLSGNAISLHGRMTAIADTFAALTTARVYANAVSTQQAMLNLFEWSGRAFHEPLVEQFVQAIGIFPVGCLVELNTGEVAIVVAHNRTTRLEPRVLVLSHPDKGPLPHPVERDLALFNRSVGSATGRMKIASGLPPGAFGFVLRDYYLA